MGAHMKTTIEIADSLFAEARELAAARHTTLRALVEAGLRQVLQEQRAPRAAFELRRASFKGRGLRAELQAEPFERLRDMAYEGRGA
jgi:Arc/MetJ family transcription regulator